MTSFFHVGSFQLSIFSRLLGGKLPVDVATIELAPQPHAHQEAHLAGVAAVLPHEVGGAEKTMVKRDAEDNFLVAFWR